MKTGRWKVMAVIATVDRAALGAAGRDRAARQVHLRQQPAAEDVAVRIGVGRHGDGAQRGLGLRRSITGVAGGHGLRTLDGIAKQSPRGD